jgi:hypothetical protein
MVRKSLRDRLGTTWIGNLTSRLIGKIEFGIMKFYKDKNTIMLFQKVLAEDPPLLQQPSELFLIYTFAKSQTDLEGDFAEVGVFKGTSARLICEAKGDKTLHLFDTFEGLPKVDKIDKKFKDNLYSADFEHVKKKLSKYSNVRFYKGLFPKTALPIEKTKFSFVHLDVDIYSSTQVCVEFFYPRMVKGGIIISHDYHAEGVRKAFVEFFKNKSEKIIELPMSQCMVIKGLLSNNMYNFT